MPGALVQVRVPAFAKLNLCLEVLNRRPDGFHNLRTVFQTISVHDDIHIAVRQAESTSIQIDSDVEIPGENLMARAAGAVLRELGVCAEIRFRIRKRIPMGGGLGGGSADAAAVLMALAPMLRSPLPTARLIEIGSQIGSDVPFFLVGGAAVGLGRGAELYPLPDGIDGHGLLIAPGIHVSTAEAYRALGRPETGAGDTHVSATEQLALALAAHGDWWSHSTNDFEHVVFDRHPEIAQIRAKLQELGARPARMTGSGSTLFGIFNAKSERDAALSHFGKTTAFPFTFVSRRRYSAIWDRVRIGVAPPPGA